MTKKILITGANSYIGTSFEEWMRRYGDRYIVDTVATENGEWKGKDFSGYDTVFHVAGIAHVKETRENEHLYYEVNRDLAFEIARKAKWQDVRQFIFLSSMSVYGMDTGAIDKDTVPAPKTHYGKSKLEGEGYISSLSSKNFKVAIVRPPMVYGRGCKGNYAALSKFAKKTPVFPQLENKRSMIYIDCFCGCIKHLIDGQESGLFFPQNSEYICTSDMVRQIARCSGRRILFPRLSGPLVRLLRFPVAQKLFGDLYYDKGMPGGTAQCCDVDFEESVRLSEARGAEGA